MAQAPQGFTYQGVATDNNGFELQNQTISIQASILSSSATGTTVWQETHTTTTDTFGLFNVTIGEGTSTNSGSSATFSEIDWGAASHFMKVEIDVNGGTNYVHVGTSQMMSVPYALYAENVHNLNMDSILGAVYDSISSSTSNQSSNVFSPISLSASPYSPLLGDYHLFDINYPVVTHIVVPSGKHFATTYISVNHCSTVDIYRGSETFTNINLSFLENLILVENDSIVFNYDGGNNPTFTFIAKAYDINPLIIPFVFTLSEGETFTVPNGKIAIPNILHGSCIYVEFDDGSINMTNLSEGHAGEYFPIWKENTQITITPNGGCTLNTGFLHGFGWYIDN